MSISPVKFREVMGNFATGITVVTTRDERTPYGITVNSFTSVSLEPPLILICLDLNVSALEIFKKVGRFAVNILAADQEEASRFFATRGSDRSQWPYGQGETGLPILKDCLGVLECELEQAVPGGDHVILLGKVLGVDVAAPEKTPKPLLYFRGRYARLDS